MVGAWGETIAAQYLQKKKFKIIATNYHCRFGEIDIIAANRKYLVFVEVKLRKNNNFAAAGEFVDRHKQERIKMTASIFLAENETELQPRFDVIEIYAPEGVQTQKPIINYLEDAFE